MDREYLSQRYEGKVVDLIQSGKSAEDIFLDLDTYFNLNPKLSPTSKRNYSKIIKRFLRVYQFKVSNKNIKEYSFADKKNKYPFLYALAHLLRAIGEHEWAESLPRPQTPITKKTFQYIPPAKITRILQILNSYNKLAYDKKSPVQTAKHNFARIAFIQYRTGIRYEETILLQADDFLFDKQPGFIVIRIHAKGGEEQFVKILSKYEPTIRKWISEKPYGFLFLNTYMDRLYTSPEKADKDRFKNYVTGSILTEYNSCLGQIGKEPDIAVPSLSSHYLRHAFADEFLRNGGELISLQKKLRHKDVKTTIRYISLADRMGDDVLSRIQ